MNTLDEKKLIEDIAKWVKKWELTPRFLTLNLNGNLYDGKGRLLSERDWTETGDMGVVLGFDSDVYECFHITTPWYEDAFQEFLDILKHHDLEMDFLDSARMILTPRDKDI